MTHPSIIISFIFLLSCTNGIQQYFIKKENGYFNDKSNESKLNAFLQKDSFTTFDYKEIGNLKLKVDIFFPKKMSHSSKPYPAIIFFHGGGWVSGNRTQFHWQCNYFAKQGMVAITADYRFIKEDYGGKEICIMDAKTAVRWVKANAKRLNIDSSKITLAGGSAGGHLAAMAAMNNTINDPKDNSSISTSVKALVLFNPAFDLDSDPLLEPFNFISIQTPPVVTFFGSMDKWKAPALIFHNDLDKIGIKSEMWTALKQRHAFFNKSPWNLSTAIIAQNFLFDQGLIKKKIESIHSTPPLIKEFK
jgi:acetyl esterase